MDRTLPPFEQRSGKTNHSIGPAAGRNHEAVMAGQVIHYWGRQTPLRHWSIKGKRRRHRAVYLDI
jgi:hypothetical protein